MHTIPVAVAELLHRTIIALCMSRLQSGIGLSSIPLCTAVVAPRHAPTSRSGTFCHCEAALQCQWQCQWQWQSRRRPAGRGRLRVRVRVTRLTIEYSSTRIQVLSRVLKAKGPCPAAAAGVIATGDVHASSVQPTCSHWQLQVS